MEASRYGLRIRALRNERGLTQSEAAVRLGFANRQTLSDIEGGQRYLLADELVRALYVFGVSLDDFTNPFRPDDGVRCFFLATGEDGGSAMRKLEVRMGGLLCFYRELAKLTGDDGQHSFGSRLGITRDSGLDGTTRAARQVAAALSMASSGRQTLAGAIESCFGIPVIAAPMPDQVLGGVCRLSGADGIFVNLDHASGRVAPTLAHLLFHGLCWDSMPRRRVEILDGSRHGRPSKGRTHAAAFASGLLEHTAEIPPVPEPLPAFGRMFMQVVRQAITCGSLSARRAASELGVTLDEINGLCEAHGLPAAHAL